MVKNAVIALLVLVSSTSVFAQEDPTSRRAAVSDVPLLERNRVFKNIPGEHTGEMYEAVLALHFSFGTGMQESYDEANLNQRPDWALLPTVSMIVNLRQLFQDSDPVRTPSYMPRFRLTAIRSAPPVANQTTTQWVFDGTIGHYSNGQEGCPFQQQDKNNGCAFPSPVDDADVVANTVNGSFTSHYLEAGAARRWIRWADTLLPNGRIPAKRTVIAFLRFRDYEALSGIRGGMEDDVKRLYGSMRIRVGSEAIFETDAASPWRGPHWINGWIEYSNGHSRVGAWRGAVEYGKTFDGVGGLGVFARGYFGHDDYNIAFLQHLNVLQVGVALGGERRPTFRP